MKNKNTQCKLREQVSTNIDPGTIVRSLGEQKRSLLTKWATGLLIVISIASSFSAQAQWIGSGTNNTQGVKTGRQFVWINWDNLYGESQLRATKTLNIRSINSNGSGHGELKFSDFTKVVMGSGNVGIGTSSPSHPLHVNGNEILSTGTRAGFKFRNRGSTSSSDDWVWYSVDNIAKLWRNGSGDLMSILTNGNVGIGTDNPTQKLEVNGNLLIDGSDNSGSVAGLMVRSGTQHMLMDGNEIDANGTLYLNFNSYEDVSMVPNGGNVGIGTGSPTEKLEVNGIVKADGVTLNIGSFPDYVFAADYDLMPLEEVDAYIQQNHHLPHMPTEAEVVEKGMDVGQINTLLVEKIEELTLHTIAQERQIKAQKYEWGEMQKAMERMRKEIVELKALFKKPNQY